MRCTNHVLQFVKSAVDIDMILSDLYTESVRVNLKITIEETNLMLNKTALADGLVIAGKVLRIKSELIYFIVEKIITSFRVAC